MKKDRITWLDASRGLAFLMVLYSHLNFCNPLLMKYFAPVFLTTFFFVSGYLFKSGYSFYQILEQRTRTLFLPFLFYGTIMLLARQFFSFHEDVVPLKQSFFDMISQNGNDDSFWFIPSLFVYSVVFYWIDKVCSDPKRLIFAIVLLFVVNYVALRNGLPRLWYRVDAVGFACGYMALGKLYRLWEKNIDILLNRFVLPFFVMFYFICVTKIPYTISFVGSPYLIDGILVTFVGLLLMVFLSKKINARYVIFIGSNSMLYFLLHGKVYSLIQSMSIKIFGNILLENAMLFTITGFLITAICSVIIMLPVVVVNKWFPFTLGKGFKIRNVNK